MCLPFPVAYQKEKPKKRRSRMFERRSNFTWSRSMTISPRSAKRYEKLCCERTPEPAVRPNREALQRAGFVVVRQRGSHIRLQKRTADTILKVTVPAHRPVKKGTLSHILKAAQISVDQFNSLL